MIENKVPPLLRAIYYHALCGEYWYKQCSDKYIVDRYLVIYSDNSPSRLSEFVDWLIICNSGYIENGEIKIKNTEYVAAAQKRRGTK
jgi:hypothetical protein